MLLIIVMSGLNLIKIGPIVRFFGINSETYCMLKMLNKTKIQYSGEEDIESVIERYFLLLNIVIKPKSLCYNVY